MNKEKRIDEMAKLICTYPQCVNYNNIGGCKIAECQTVDIAENLYNAGYRKASDVAREIFEEIERFLYMHFRFCKEEIGNDDTEYVKGRLELNTQIQNLIAELKKKYESEKDE